MTVQKQYDGAAKQHVGSSTFNLGAFGIGGKEHKGLIKCRLVHGVGVSIITPDFLFVGSNAERWIQPRSFGPPWLEKFGDDKIRCRFSIDIAGGHRLLVTFWQQDLLQQFSDGSELYSCVFKGPEELEEAVTGKSVYAAGSPPLVKLFHHTTPSKKESILTSAEFWLSPWNIQGTEKKLKNIGYVYFTPVEKIATPDDLKLIAMASNGVLTFIVDDFNPPILVPLDWKVRFADKLLELKVYRESTTGRTDSLAFNIDVTALAPQHLLRHAPKNDQVWYEVCAPFVQRVGLQPGSTLRFTGPNILSDPLPLKRFEYLVVGDARTVSGLAAPYNEEETKDILKIEVNVDERGILSYWFLHGNTDLFTDKNIDFQEFDEA